MLSTTDTADGKLYLDSGVHPMSCASVTFCAAVDRTGHAFTYNGTTWSTPNQVTSYTFQGVSCPTATDCVAIDASGDALTYNGSIWSGATNIDGPSSVKSVSCVHRQLLLGRERHVFLAHSLLRAGGSRRKDLQEQEDSADDVSGEVAPVTWRGTVSDSSQGFGWWLASDGKWYRPELHPDYRAAPPTAPPIGLPQFGSHSHAVAPPSHKPSQPSSPLPQLPGAALPHLFAPRPDDTATFQRGPEGVQSPTPFPAPRSPFLYSGQGSPNSKRSDVRSVPPRDAAGPPRRRHRRSPGTFLLLLVLIGVAGVYAAPRIFHSTPGLSAYANAPQAGPPNPTPAAMANPATAQAVASTVMVEALGCGANVLHRGSGWPIGSHYIATDAHVVSGSNGVAIQLPGQPLHLATVVYFNAAEDIALLDVPTASFTPMTLAVADPNPQVNGLFIGYPGSNGTNETDLLGWAGGVANVSYDYPTPGAVHTTEDFDAAGADPGMSGGPVVNSSGMVIGLIQSSNGEGGQALQPSMIRSTIETAVGLTSGVSDGSCATN